MSDSPRRAPRPGIARHGRLPRRRGWGTLLSVVATTAAVVLLSATSVVAIAGAQLTAAPKTVALSKDDQNVANTANIAAIKGGANILLIGSDTRIGQFDSADKVEGARNDVTILIHISQDHQHLTVVSIPRDLEVPIPACTNPESGQTYPAVARGDLLNDSLGHGGISCVVDTVENLTGLRIPYAGLITFDGVTAMSNAVGGVEVCVAAPIDDHYIGLQLSPGEHTLKGAQALQFLRSRHGVGDSSDLARISSQQVFLSALLRRVTSDGTLSNPVTLYRLAGAALSNMTLSDGLHKASTIVGLASVLRSMNTSDMLFVQYPVLGDPADPDRVIVEQDPAHALNVALQTDEATTLSDSSTGRASTVAPGAGTPSAAASPGTGSAPSSAASSSPSTSSGSASGSHPSATALPSSITGQSAAEQTCSVGNGG